MKTRLPPRTLSLCSLIVVNHLDLSPIKLVLVDNEKDSINNEASEEEEEEEDKRGTKGKKEALSLNEKQAEQQNVQQSEDMILILNLKRRMRSGNIYKKRKNCVSADQRSRRRRSGVLYPITFRSIILFVHFQCFNSTDNDNV